MNKKPLILVTNDDSIEAPGIKKLAEVMKTLGDVVVVAPKYPQSGMGHAVTLSSPLYVEKSVIKNTTIEAYTCSGTPVDCVKIALNEVLNRKPDLVVSGINHGLNSGTCVLYSGTMGAAIEAGMNEVSAIGFSIDEFSWDAQFEQYEDSIIKITSEVLKNKLPKETVLNVNFPKLETYESIKGIKICRQAYAIWEEKFDKRTSPFGKEYYWLAGAFVDKDKGTDTDEWALKNRFVSVVPVKFDLTDYTILKELDKWNL